MDTSVPKTIRYAIGVYKTILYGIGNITNDGDVQIIVEAKVPTTVK